MAIPPAHRVHADEAREPAITGHRMPLTSVLRKFLDPATGPIGLGLIGACLLFLWSALAFRRIRLKEAARLARTAAA
jgi:hypothetical protein